MNKSEIFLMDTYISFPDSIYLGAPITDMNQL